MYSCTPVPVGMVPTEPQFVRFVFDDPLSGFDVSVWDQAYCKVTDVSHNRRFRPGHEFAIKRANNG